MKTFRKYFLLFLLLSFLFPIGEKVIHDIEHFNDDCCEIKNIHYCKASHTCFICDYIFTSPLHSFLIQERIVVFGKTIIILSLVIVFNIILPQKFTFTLRGPPKDHNFHNKYCTNISVF